MVKNTHGGNKHKGFARKHTTAKASNKLRTSEDEGEIYAIATKMLGNNMFHCHCIDNVLRLCHIRGKFTGRGKRDNMITTGTWVLIGIREWDSYKSDKDIQKCDLLEVYSDLDKERLKDRVTLEWHILDDNDVKKDKLTQSNTTDVHFITQEDEDRERFIREMNSETNERITFQIEEKEEDVEEEINVDDI